MKGFLPRRSESQPLMGWIRAVTIPLLPPMLSRKPSVLIGAPRLRTKGCHTACIMLENRPARKAVVAITRRFWLIPRFSILSSLILPLFNGPAMKLYLLVRVKGFFT